jgi:hypothetical protein
MSKGSESGLTKQSNVIIKLSISAEYKYTHENVCFYIYILYSACARTQTFLLSGE